MSSDNPPQSKIFSDWDRKGMVVDDLQPVSLSELIGNDVVDVSADVADASDTQIE